MTNIELIERLKQFPPLDDVRVSNKEYKLGFPRIEGVGRSPWKDDELIIFIDYIYCDVN